MRKLLCVSLLVVGACADEAPPAAPPPSPPPPVAPVQAAPPPSPPLPVTLASDTPKATSGGTAFTAPAGWSFLANGATARLTGPEPDLAITIVDSTEKTADDAVASAWRASHPGFKWPLRVATQRPGRRGWEERRDYTYETSPDEKLELTARAVRKGASWTVLLVEGGDASFQKRLAAVVQVQDSLHASGWAPESFAGKTPYKLDEGRAKQIVLAMDRARELAGIPGVAISLVQDGTVVWEGGLGVREIGKPEKVDAHTKFMIASNTKGMTTLLLAKLVDEGKLTWETPVSSLWPSFKLGDAETTRQVLVKHLVCACTGLPRQDYEWLLNYEKQTPKTEMDLLGTMQPTTKFGEAYQYSNMLAAAGGYLAAYVVDPKRELGAAYDAAMQSRVFGPLGMTETTFDFDRALKANRALPFDYDADGKMGAAPIEVDRAVGPVRPAGGAWSSVHDVAKYVSMEIARGTLPNGKRYVSEEALLARRKPQVSSGQYSTYGMGLSVDNEWGVPVVHHGGSIIGFKSDLFWIPEAGVGGVILATGPGHLLTRAFLRKTLEVLYDGHPEAEEDAAASIGTLRANLAAERPKVVIPADPGVASQLAKRYANASIGQILVTSNPKGVTFTFGGWKSPVGSRKNDDGTTSVVTIAPGIMWLTFVVGTRDGKRTLMLRDSQHEYLFTEA